MLLLFLWNNINNCLHVCARVDLYLIFTLKSLLEIQVLEVRSLFFRAQELCENRGGRP